MGEVGRGLKRQKEMREGWYDCGARFYDTQLGRWHAVDILSEKFPQLSPYCYISNNPIMLIDPNGMEIVSLGK